MQDHDLIAKIRDHDKGALDELFSRYVKRAYAISFHLCSGDRESAQDLTQEALLKAVRNIDNFRGEAAFSTWLYRIIYNAYLDSRKQHSRWKDIFSPRRWKKQKGEINVEILDEPPETRGSGNPNRILREKQFSRDVKNALKALPLMQRIVFQLKVYSEMTIREIAQTMNIAEGTVKSHLFRATRHLREKLSDWES